MSELVERLRERAAALSEGPMASTMRDTIEWQAADEIARLTAIAYDAETANYRLAARVKELEETVRQLQSALAKVEPGDAIG